MPSRYGLSLYIFGYAVPLALVASLMTRDAVAQREGGFAQDSTLGRGSSMRTDQGPFGRPGQAAGSDARPGPFGQSAQSNFFGNNGLQMLELAGLSAFFSRGQSDPLGGPAGFNQTPLGGRMNNFGRFPFNPAAQRPRGPGEQTRPPVRTTFSVGFPLPDVSSGQVQQRLSRTLSSASIAAPGDIDVTVTTRATGPEEATGVTAVLRGRVASQEDRAVAEQLVRLDPGVASVQNELEVMGDAPLPPAGDSP